MKKVRILVAVVVAALLCMGMGYAAWSQSIPISVYGTLAKVNVHVVSTSYDYSPYLQQTVGIVDGTALNVKIDGMYPGRDTRFYATFQNDSTMPVTLSKFVFTGKENRDVLNKISIYIQEINSWFTLNTDGSLDSNIVFNPGDVKTITFYIAVDKSLPQNCSSAAFKFLVEPQFTVG